ncbi:hypothetical protein Vafri_15725 [Volvox africanus]|nr:hypothetical protein Vafri_15725 [Volvox africanus]
MTAMDGRRGQGASGTPMGLINSSPGPFGANSSSRLFSASLTGPGLGGRARPTTQEIIAEAFGRRLHGLELLSVKKLNALNASAAKIEAHVASRAAAISRTSVAATEGGLGLGAGSGSGGTAVAAKSASVMAAAASANVSGGGGSEDTGDDPEHQPLSSIISVAFPATGIGVPPGTLGSPQQHNSGAKAGGNAAPDIARRGTQVVRLLALQDKILHGALDSSQQQLLLSSTSSQSQSQMQLTLLSPTTGTRFITLASGEQGGGSGGTLSTDEQRRLDQLGIKYDSKVAAATIKLFRLSPRGPGDARSQSQSREGAPATPPNTHRTYCLPDLGTTEESSEAMRGELSANGRRQLARSKEFSTMTRFIQSLQDGDEMALARQARNFARLNSSAPSSQAVASLPTSPSRAATAPVSLPNLSPLRTSQAHHIPEPQSPGQLSSMVDSSPQPHSVAEVKTSGLHHPHPHKQLTLEVPESPILGVDLGSSMVPTHSPTRSIASSSSRLVSPSKIGPQLQHELDLGSVCSGQVRSKDLLDGLMKAVEMFVGAGGAGPGSSPGLGSRGRHSTKVVTGATGKESPFGNLTVTAAAMVPTDDEEEIMDPESPMPPYSGVYGSPDILTDRVRKKGALAVLTNPAGFREEVAAGEVAMYRDVAHSCRTALARTAKHPRDAVMAADLQRKVANLHYCRPYFVAPRETLPELMIPLRPVSACSVSRQNTHFVQSAPRESVFLPRAEESESEDMIDTNAIRERQVRKDWNRVVRKDAFRALVGVEDPGAASGTTGLGHALDACLAVILRHKDSLRAAFTYYSMQASSINDYCFALGLPEWRTFIADCGFGGQPGEGGRSTTPNTATATAAGAVAMSVPAAGNGRTSNIGRTGPSSQLQQPAAGGTSGTAGQRASKGPGATLAARVSMAGGGTGAGTGAGTGVGAGASTGTGIGTGTGTGVSPLKSRPAGGADGSAGGGGAAGVTRPSARGGSQIQGLAAAATAAASSSSAATSAAVGAAAGPGGGAALMSQQSNQLADAVFAAVNVDPEKRIVDGHVVLNRSLLRFEWYEALLRLATIRHVKAGTKCSSIAAALEHMWTREVLPVLLSTIVHEPNIWRIVRLYGDPEVNELLIAHMDLITALYGLFIAASKNQLMHLSDWIGLLNTCALIGDGTGVTLHAAKLAYTRSLCVVVDDQGQWSRAVCLTKCDFMEALARLAEELAPPPLEEVAEAMREVGITGRRLRVALEQPWTYYYNELPVELLVARRLAAAEAAAARSTTTGEDSALPSLQNSISKLDLGNKASHLDVPGGSAVVAMLGPPSPAPNCGPSLLLVPAPPSSWNSLPKLSFRLEALLELMFGRLRDHWECTDNQQLMARLQATTITLQATP